MSDENLEELTEEKWAEILAEDPVPVKKERPAPPQMITFDRYFVSLGRPMHHKAGMAAFTNTKGKKTIEAWDALFEKY